MRNTFDSSLLQEYDYTADIFMNITSSIILINEGEKYLNHFFEETRDELNNFFNRIKVDHMSRPVLNGFKMNYRSYFRDIDRIELENCLIDYTKYMNKIIIEEKYYPKINVIWTESTNVADTLLALHEGKKKIKSVNNVIFFSQESESFGIAKEMNRNLPIYQNIIEDENGLGIFAQPIVDLRGKNRFSNFEILSRFRDSGGNNISPIDFFKAIEYSGNSNIVDNKILIKTLNQLKDSFRNNDYSFALNVSPQTVSNKTPFLKKLVKISKEFGIEPEQITLEVNEKSKNGLDSFIKSCFRKGINVSYDDFGMGNTSYEKLESILKNNAADLSKFFLKIDKSCLEEISDDNSISNAKMTLPLAYREENPDMKLIVEGIEDEGTHIYVSGLEIDYGQGYFYQKPTLLTKDYIQPVSNFS